MNPRNMAATEGSENTLEPQKGLTEEQAISLGPRERQVIDLLLQGCDNAAIAREF